MTEDFKNKVFNKDVLQVLKRLPDNSFDMVYYAIAVIKEMPKESYILTAEQILLKLGAYRLILK